MKGPVLDPPFYPLSADSEEPRPKVGVLLRKKQIILGPFNPRAQLTYYTRTFWLFHVKDSYSSPRNSSKERSSNSLCCSSSLTG
jgi:hypothetical protein